MKFPLPSLSSRLLKNIFLARQKPKKGELSSSSVVLCESVSQHCVSVFPASVFTICRSSMRAFTPASISFLSWGVSGHGYKVALNLKTDEQTQIRKRQEHFTKFYKCWPVIYPSQIFLTLFLSWSPWKKMMKTDLWTWSPCGNITQLGLW